MKKEELKKQLILIIPYVFVFYATHKLLMIYRILPETNPILRLFETLSSVNYVIKKPLLSSNINDYIGALFITIALYSIIYYKRKNAKKFRKGIEYGSARWGNKSDILPFMDKKDDKNLLFTETEGITIDTRNKKPEYQRNCNVLVIGGSGSGKTRFFIKPNLMQMHSSYVVTDPKGLLF